MIRSMTAFADAELATTWGTLAWELRSVNHRFLEITPRLPDDVRAMEPVVRERLAARLARGKVDAILRIKRDSAPPARLQLNEPLAQGLAELVARLDVHFTAHRPQLSVTDLLAWPGMLVEPDVDSQALQAAALALLDTAIDNLAAARAREGERLAVMLHERMAGIEQHVLTLRRLLPEIRTALRQRLDTRLAELRQPLDPGRLEQELVLSLQKLDIDEELDRLDSHLAEARRTLGLSEAVGRRLDFLMQEFNREANTLGSKSVDGRSSQTAVELKVLIEQMREQVQNIE